MRIDFIDNNTVVASTDKLIDIDLSYYDNVLVSKPVAPEVRFTIAYNHLDNNDPFVTWWKTITQGEIPENVFAVIYDGSGYEVASGDLFEYDEDLQNFALEILIVPGFTQELDANTKIKKDLKAYDIYRDSTIPYISNILKQHFLRLWIKANMPFPVQLNAPISGMYWDFYTPAQSIQYAIQSQINTGDLHYLRFESNFDGTKHSFVESIAFTNVLKLIWSKQSKAFKSQSVAIPKQIHGFITATSYDELDDVSFSRVVKSVKIADISGSSTDITSLFYSHTQQRLNHLTFRKKYHIQGNVAFTWLYPGDSISLNGQRYIIREINYDPVSLNTISHMGANLNLKFFNAVCVKGS